MKELDFNSYLAGLSITCSLRRKEFNVVKNWQYAQISTQKKYAQISKNIFFLGVFETRGVFFAPKMLKYAPKWLKLMPEILKMPIFVTQFNFKVSKFRLTSTNYKQNAPKLLKSKKTCAQNRYKNTGCKGFCAMERPVWHNVFPRHLKSILA
jgi:hypothetical protein